MKAGLRRVQICLMVWIKCFVSDLGCRVGRVLRLKMREAERERERVSEREVDSESEGVRERECCT